VFDTEAAVEPDTEVVVPGIVVVLEVEEVEVLDTVVA